MINYQMDSYSKLSEYFQSNRNAIIKKYNELITRFSQSYDELVKVKQALPPLTVRQGTAIALLFRAMKFLYVALDLSLSGHTDESRLLLRNVMEIRIVALDIVLNQEAYELWQVVQKERETEKQKNDNIVDSQQIKAALISRIGQDINKFDFKSSIRRIKKHKDEKINSLVDKILQDHDDLSKFVNHENLYNLARRTDVKTNPDGTASTSAYLGYDSTDKYLDVFILGIVNIMTELKNDTLLILGKVS